MPLFAFGKERFDPDLSLAHGLVIRLGDVISPDSLDILLIKMVPDETPLITAGALWLERTAVAGGRVTLIALLTLCGGRATQQQESIVRTDVDIPLGIIAELVLLRSSSST